MKSHNGQERQNVHLQVLVHVTLERLVAHLFMALRALYAVRGLEIKRVN